VQSPFHRSVIRIIGRHSINPINRIGTKPTRLIVTFLQGNVNIPNLTFLTNFASRGLFSYYYFLAKLILLGDCAVS
jgi:hypothetical protein